VLGQRQTVHLISFMKLN